MHNICTNESLRDTGRRKKIVFAASFLDMLVVMPLFVRDRYRYIGRDAAHRKYPVNSRSKIFECKLLNFIQSNEEISTLKQ
jgi:hypothetical protein